MRERAPGFKEEREEELNEEGVAYFLRKLYGALHVPRGYVELDE